MLNDDELLGAALAKQLHALVSDIEPSPRLIERIDSEIREPRPTRLMWLPRRLRRPILVVSVPTMAAIAAAIIVLGGSEASPSFAVARGTDGAVLVTVHDLQGVAGANAKLQELGIDNVAVVPIRADCHTRVDLTYTGIGTQHETTIRVTPSAIPPNTTVLLAAAPLSSGGVELALGRVTGPAPPCVAPGQSGLGISGVTPATNAESSQTATSGQS